MAKTQFCVLEGRRTKMNLCFNQTRDCGSKWAGSSLTLQNVSAAAPLNVNNQHLEHMQNVLFQILKNYLFAQDTFVKFLPETTL